MDGVIVNSIPRWIEVMNRLAGTTFSLDEYPDIYGIPALAALCDEHEVHMTIGAQPLEGAVEAIASLKTAGHTLVVVTARARRLRRLTEAWLEYYGIAVDGLHFLEGGAKGPVVRAERLDLLVEDAPHNALAVAETGVPVLLFGAPYNRAVQHRLVERCEGWAGVLARISERDTEEAV